MPTISLENKLSELSKLVGIVTRFAADHQLSIATLHDVNLVLEELFVNTVEHGGADASAQPIVLDIERQGNLVVAALADSGAPFNPMEHHCESYGLPAEQRGIGGLGIHLIQKLCLTMSYVRKEHRNVTVVRLQIRA